MKKFLVVLVLALSLATPATVEGLGGFRQDTPDEAPTLMQIKRDAIQSVLEFLQ